MNQEHKSLLNKAVLLATQAAIDKSVTAAMVETEFKIDELPNGAIRTHIHEMLGTRLETTFVVWADGRMEIVPQIPVKGINNWEKLYETAQDIIDDVNSVSEQGSESPAN